MPVTVGTAAQADLTCHPFAFLELQVDAALDAIHGIIHGAIGTHDHLFEVTGLDAFEQRLVVHTQHDVVYAKQVVGRERLAVVWHQFRTDMQYVEQRHLWIGIQLFNMDDVFAALVLDNLFLGPRCKEAPSHKATKQEEFKSNCSHYIRNLAAKVQKKA